MANGSSSAALRDMSAHAWLLGPGPRPRSAGPLARSALLLAFVGFLCLLPSAVHAQTLRMSVRAGFDGFYKDSQWMPVVVDLDNRGQRVEGSLAVVVPHDPGGATATTYLRPVVLGSKARQRRMLYVHARDLSGQLVVRLRARRGPDARGDASLTQLSTDDSLIVMLGPERGMLSFLSGTTRALTHGSPTRPPRGAPSTQGEIRVADLVPDLLPDLAQGYAAVDLLVIGDISVRGLRPEVKDALRRWVLSGGALVVMGGPDWARLKDPLFQDLLPVEVTGAAQVRDLGALGLAYGSPLSGPAVITRAAPKPGASVRVSQGDLPLIVDGPVGAGRVIFFAFDAGRPPLRGWAGQSALWNDCLSRAEDATPLLRAALSDYGDPYGYYGYGGGPYGRGAGRLAAAVLNIPSMQTPPFWGVALFLGGYVVLLVPVNYIVLKWRRRRELAWLTTPAIVLLFAFLAYFIGYSMKGGRLLVNQLSFIETQAGAQSAGLTSFAGLFSPGKTSYHLGADDPGAVLSEVAADARGRGRKNLTVLQTETISLPQVPMDMWSMRVFKIEGLADLGQGLEGRLALASGRAQGQVTNRTGFDLTNCEARLGGAVQQLGDLAHGETVKVSLNVGTGQPARIGSTGYPGGYHYGGGPRQPSGAGRGAAARQMRAEVQDAFFGSGSPQVQSGPILTGWCDQRFADLTVQGHAFEPTRLTFVIVHLPLTVGRRGRVTIPYGVSGGTVIEEQGTDYGYGQPGVDIQAGFLVKEFRLPIEGSSLRVRRLEVYADFAPQSGNTAKVALQVYNWKTGAWDKLPANRGAVAVPNPTAHVRLPQGLVRVRVEGSRAGSASGGDLLLSRLDVSLKGDIR